MTWKNYSKSNTWRVSDWGRLYNHQVPTQEHILNHLFLSWINVKKKRKKYFYRYINLSQSLALCMFCWAINNGRLHLALTAHWSKFGRKYIKWWTKMGWRHSRISSHFNSIRRNSSSSNKRHPTFEDS